MENKKTNEEYAKNYLVIKTDGFFGPLSVVNIAEYNDRDLINVCVKTQLSGEKECHDFLSDELGKKLPGSLQVTR